MQYICGYITEDIRILHWIMIDFSPIYADENGQNLFDESMIDDPKFHSVVEKIITIDHIGFVTY